VRVRVGVGVRALASRPAPPLPPGGRGSLPFFNFLTRWRCSKEGGILHACACMLACLLRRLSSGRWAACTAPHDPTPCLHLWGRVCLRCLPQCFLSMRGGAAAPGPACCCCATPTMGSSTCCCATLLRGGVLSGLGCAARDTRDTCAHACTHTVTHTRSHTQTHTHTHTHTRTHVHTHTHTHARTQVLAEYAAKLPPGSSASSSMPVLSNLGPQGARQQHQQHHQSHQQQGEGGAALLPEEYQQKRELVGAWP